MGTKIIEVFTPGDCPYHDGTGSYCAADAFFVLECDQTDSEFPVDCPLKNMPKVCSCPTETT